MSSIRSCFIRLISAAAGNYTRAPRRRPPLRGQGGWPPPLPFHLLRERDVDGDHYYGQDDGQDQQLSQDLTLLLPLHRVALLQSVEPGVEPAGGQELLVGAYLRDAAVLDHQDLVHVPHQA
jgi:hypothetical protein